MTPAAGVPDGASGSGAGAASEAERARLAAPIPKFGDDWKQRRREEVNERVAIVQRQLERYLSDDVTWKEWVSKTRQLHRVSIRNAILADLQLEAKNGDDEDFDPSGLVLPASTWKRVFGRTVRPECFRKGFQAAEDDRYCVLMLRPETRNRYADVVDENGQKVIDEKTGRVKRRPTGETYRVFEPYEAYHVAATEGDPMPDHPWGHATGSDDDARLLIGHLEQAASQQGVTVLFERPTSRTARGEYEPATETIRVDPRLSPADQAKTLTHEFVHHVAGDGSDDSVSRQVAEISTESAAAIVAGQYGLEYDDCSIPYLAAWTRENPKLISKLSGEIMRRCDAFFLAVDPVAQALAADKAKAPERAAQAAERRKQRAAARRKKPRRSSGPRKAAATAAAAA